MAVNWNLALQQTGREALDYIDAFTIGRKAAQEQNALNARTKASAQAQTGDYAGAQKTAAAAGDFDYAKVMAGLDESQRKKTAQEAEVSGSVAFGLRQLPREQRAEAFRQAIPALSAHLPPEAIEQARQQLEGMGWADGALDGYINMATSVKDAMAQYTKANEQYTLAPGSTRRDAKGNIIAAQPFAPQIREVGEGKSLVEVQPGGGGQASGGAPVGDVAGFVAQSGGRVTSGTRTPERNRDVGGKANSLHLSGDAIDTVPPQGVSMSEWASHLATQFPGARVINEGDHVHVQARGSGMGSRVIAQGPPKQEYRTLSPEEATARGLTGGSVYQISPTGQISAVSGTGSAGSTRKSEAELRKEFNGLAEVKNFRTVKSQGETILRLARDQAGRIKNGQPATPQNDISMIFSYMKMLDPTSVVREGEFATAQNAAGVPDRIINAYNKAREGVLMNARQRQEMVNAARQVFLAARGTYNSRADEFRSYAEDYEVDPDRVARTDNDVTKPKAAAPSQGWGKATVKR